MRGERVKQRPFHESDANVIPLNNAIAIVAMKYNPACASPLVYSSSN